MKNRTKKHLLVAGCLVVCVVAIGMIGSSFTKEPIPDAPLPANDTIAGGVSVDAGMEPGVSDVKNDKASVVVKPDTSIPADIMDNKGRAVSTGTEQTIQREVKKPEYDPETLKDPTKTPDGEKVSEPPQHVDHDSLTTPPPESRPPSNSNGGNGNNNGGSSGVLPGFDNVPNLGPNQGETLNDMYENGNKIGIMG